VRALIEQRLRSPRPAADPRDRILANVVGQASTELLDALAASSRRAAVLLGLVERAPGIAVLFTERAAHLKHHPSQISFPGGRLEAAGETPIAAALREAHEEIGLDPRDVAIAGCLDTQVTSTGFSVTPVVGFVGGSFEARPDPAEVQSVFEVPLQHFLAADTLRETYRERLGSRFRTYEFNYEGRVIWGATAAILVAFRELLLNEKSTR
jgi:8-oxo-dGTP pyrophosphatase MutT (NUDIX family)